jgi:integrase
MSDRESVEGVVLISEPALNALTERQQVSYREHRRKYVKWLVEDYAEDTRKVYASILDQLHRYIWIDKGGFTTEITHDHSDDFLTEQKESNEDYSTSYLDNIKLAIKSYFEWKGDPWDTDIKIEGGKSGVSQPKDYLTKPERQKIRDAVLEYGSVPSYAALTPEKRREWKIHLAQRFGKAVRDIGQDDWERANGFKYVSIVNVSLDGGLRPVEVGRATVDWVDLDNCVLRIPEDESSKNTDNWRVSLTETTTEYLARWLEERELYDKYDDTNALWLTRHGNPYRSKSLNLLLDNLREIAGIERDLTWYALRHSTGTYVTQERGLAATQAQLRHKRKQTTMRYDQAPPEDRQDALEDIG